MNCKKLILGITTALMLAAPAFAADSVDGPREKLARLNWQRGPGNGAVGGRASIEIPKDASFLVEKDSLGFLEATGNIPQPGYSVLMAKNWFAVFRFNDEGYVKDEEKIDADALLATLKASDGPDNEERRKRNLPELTTEGWYLPPFYDSQTKHLEWALKLRSGGSSESLINYSVKILGRRGHESATLVSSPATLSRDVAEFKAALEGFKFNQGERYEQFVSGDKTAEYGLGALILGGAAAVAAKKGLWTGIIAAAAAFWKFIAAAVIAGLAAIGKFLGRKKIP